MVTYGPWIQDPDYLQYQTVSQSSGNDYADGMPLFGYGLKATETETPFQDPAYPITEQDLKRSYDVVNPNTPDGDATAVTNAWGSTYSWGYQLSLPAGVASTWGAQTARRWGRVVPHEYSYNPSNFFPRDPAAIGIDYEGAPYDPTLQYPLNLSGPASKVSRAISWASELRGMWRDDSRGTEAAVRPFSTTEIWLLPAGTGDPIKVGEVGPPDAVSDGANALVRTLDTTIDLTPWIQEYGWAGKIWTRQPAFVPPANGPGPDSTGRVDYGWGFADLRIDTVVRPPRYRWVYATEPAESYRRIFPRDDALGAGAARTFPRPRSAQGSNRTSGGYL